MKKRKMKRGKRKKTSSSHGHSAALYGAQSLQSLVCLGLLVSIRENQLRGESFLPQMRMSTPRTTQLLVHVGLKRDLLIFSLLNLTKSLQLLSERRRGLKRLKSVARQK